VWVGISQEAVLNQMVKRTTEMASTSAEVHCVPVNHSEILVVEN
jgi:hypothetical protein